MRLLFAENLSPDLSSLRALAFPQSAHVRSLGLVGADDIEIWAAAARQDFVLVTKDDDFRELAILRGAPPKVVVLGLGNCRTAEVVRFLESAKSMIEQFAGDPSASLLELP